jgi:hypothetical protein
MWGALRASPSYRKAWHVQTLSVAPHPSVASVTRNLLYCRCLATSFTLKGPEHVCLLVSFCYINRAMLFTLLFSQYDSPTSCDATYEQFESYLPGVCFPLRSTSSIKYSGVDSYEYASSNCGTEPVVTRLSTNCAPVTVYPNDAVNNVASKWI